MAIGWSVCGDCRQRYFTADGHRCKQAKKSRKGVVPNGPVHPAADKTVPPEPVRVEGVEFPEPEPYQREVVETLGGDGLTPQQRWRAKNYGHVLAKQREYQRAYRARQKEKG